MDKVRKLLKTLKDEARNVPIAENLVKNIYRHTIEIVGFGSRTLQ